MCSMTKTCFHGKLQIVMSQLVKTKTKTLLLTPGRPKLHRQADRHQAILDYYGEQKLQYQTHNTLKSNVPTGVSNEYAHSSLYTFSPPRGDRIFET